MLSNFKGPILIAIVGGIFGIVLLWSSIFFTIEAGESAVMFKIFEGGTDKNNVLRPGFHSKLPWNSVYVYKTRENTLTQSLNILDKSGLNIKVDVTVRYYPMEKELGFLHDEFGVSYNKLLIEPEVRGTVRKAMGKFTSEEIYSTKRSEVENEIIMLMKRNFEKNHITLRQLIIRSIILPKQIEKAIEDKLTQEQEAVAHKYRLEKEKIEMERRVIAAEGQAKANDIINSSLTEKLLKMRGVEATQKLSESPNTKIIVIGGKDGLPIILGDN